MSNDAKLVKSISVSHLMQTARDSLQSELLM
jgi:hypothetical protein